MPDSIRLPEAIKNEIKIIMADERRNMSNAIIKLITEALAARKEAATKPKKK